MLPDRPTPSRPTRRPYPVAAWALALGLSLTPAATPPPDPIPPRILAETWAQNERELGDWLLAELQCIACHLPPDSLRDRFLLRQAPDLARSLPLQLPDHARQFLEAPASLRPGTRMPDLLHALDPAERARRLDALAAFLAPTAAAEPIPAPTPLRFAQGQLLYHQVGCVQCHPPFEAAADLFDDPPPIVDDAWIQPSTPTPEPPAPRVTVALDAVGRLWTPGGLSRFLRDPNEFRPDGRMPSLALSRAEADALAVYLIQQTRTSPAALRSIDRGAPPAPPPPPALADLGRHEFSRMGCAACHPQPVHGSPIPSALTAPPLLELAGAQLTGCLAEEPPSNAPLYPLSPRQRTALTLALDALAADPEPLEPAAAVHLLMAAHNCHACHSRGSLGGPAPATRSFFRSLADQDLGDEGRFPPALDRVGAKLREDWWPIVLQQRVRPRPYLATRMPLIPPATAARFARVFRAADASLLPRADDPPEVPLEVGRRLISEEGYACVTCHRLEGRPAPVLSAMDLTWMHPRLQWDWFRFYLENPSSLRPGTQMPGFWPDGHAAFPDLLEGDPTAQIGAIWGFLESLPRPDGVPAP